jgi:membrane protease YdiL (CAAX protease family)
VPRDEGSLREKLSENRMDDETPQLAARDEIRSAPSSQSTLSTIFHNEQGLRAGWRLAMYLVIVLVFSLAINFALDKIFHLPKTNAQSFTRLLLLESLSFAIVFVPAWLMAWFEHRSVGEYGLPLHSFFGARFWQGCALGLSEIAVLMGCIAAFGGYSFGPLNVHGAAILKWAIYWAIFFVMVGLFEEFAFRGYLQFTLGDGIGFWPAAWILSLGFGAVHLMNKGESPVGALSVATIGLIFAFTLKRTGDLWLLVGWHAAFDFGETFLFSVPNSGNVFEGHLSNATLHGPIWLTGGTVGPEGSIFSFITMAAAVIVIHKAFPPRKLGKPLPENQTSAIATPQ